MPTANTKTLNPYIIIWLLMQLCIVLFTKSATHIEERILFWITIPFFILNCAAVVLIVFGQRKIGGMLFLIGSAIFVPIGIIGAIGARKVLDTVAEENFKKTI